MKTIPSGSPKKYYRLPEIAQEWKYTIEDLFYYASQGTLKLSVYLTNITATVECEKNEDGYSWPYEVAFPEMLDGVYDFPDRNTKRLKPQSECSLFPGESESNFYYNLPDLYIRQIRTDGYGHGWTLPHKENNNWFYRLPVEHKVFVSDIVVMAAEKQSFKRNGIMSGKTVKNLVPASVSRFISGKEIVARYGLQPFQLVHYCRKDLQPYEPLSGRLVRDPVLNPLSLPYTKEQYELQNLHLELGKKNIGVTLGSGPGEVFSAMSSSRLKEIEARKNALECKGVKCPPFNCPTRVQQLPEYNNYKWKRFDIPSDGNEAKRHLHDFLEYLYKIDEVVKLAEEDGLHQNGPQEQVKPEEKAPTKKRKPMDFLIHRILEDDPNISATSAWKKLKSYDEIDSIQEFKPIECGDDKEKAFIITQAPKTKKTYTPLKFRSFEKKLSQAKKVRNTT